MNIPLLDLKAQYATLRSELIDAVVEVMDSQVCIGGPNVAELEKAVAEASGCRFAVGCSSGTDALLNVMMSLDLKPGDEVITTPFTFFATAGSIARTGATPVFVDIDPLTFNIDPRLIEERITSRTKAIMPVHLFGQLADMDAIMSIANRHGIPVVEDAAQSITAAYKGKKAGSFGLAGCFSFFPSKNLGGLGDGGMIVTNDQAFYERLSLMRSHGSQPKYFHKFVGGNFRLDPIQAAALLVKLPHLDSWSEARRSHAAAYNEAFRGTKVIPPFIADDCVSIYNQYVVRVPQRDSVIAFLKAQRIGSEVYYPLPMHLQECFASLGYKRGDFPESEKAANEVLALPVYPELTPEMRDRVADCVLTAVDVHDLVSA